MALFDPVRRAHVKGPTAYFPFGETKSRNVLASSPLNAESSIKVLLLGCGDLRHVLHTAAELNDVAEAHFYVNDINGSAIARNAFILDVLTSPSLDMENDEDLNFLWDFWYNMDWTKRTKDKFLQLMNETKEKQQWRNWFLIEENLSTVETVWQFWEANIAAASPTTIAGAKRTRERGLQGNVDANVRLQGLELACAITGASALTSDFLGPNTSIDPAANRAMKVFLKPIEHYYRTGNAVKPNYRSSRTVCINPTMLQPGAELWDISHDATPFHTYYPIPNNQYGTNLNVVGYCQSVFKQRASAFRRLYLQGKVRVYFYIEDAVEFCTNLREAPYDVIDTGTLSDATGLANLLLVAPPLLRDKFSVLFTESEPTLGMESVRSYLKLVLDIPRSLLPAFFGVRLVDDFDFGSDTPCPSAGRGVFRLRWALPAVSTDPKPTLDLTGGVFRDCIDQLSEKCLFSEAMVHENTGWVRYTPLTLGLVLRSMSSRMDFDLEEALGAVDVGSELALTWKIITHCLTGGKVLQFLSPTIVPSMMSTVFIGYDGLPSSLNIFPQMEYFDNKKSVSHPELESDYSLVDNLRLEFTLNKTVESLTFSFLVPSDVPDLERRVGCIQLLDIVTEDYLLEKTLSLQSFTLKECGENKLPPTVPAAVAPRQEHAVFKVLEMKETEETYEMTLGYKNHNLETMKKMLNVEFEHTGSCPGSHRARITLRGSFAMKPLEATFAHPVFCDRDSFSLLWNKNGKSVDVVFTKTLSGPWPEDYEASERGAPKITVDDLKPWGQYATGAVLSLHLEKQLLSQDELLVMDTLALPKVNDRAYLTNVIMEIFNKVREGKTCLQISYLTCLPGLNHEGLYMTVHEPFIRYSDKGTPLLCVTVYDRRRATQLQKEKLLQATKTTRDLARIMPWVTQATGLCSNCCTNVDYISLFSYKIDALLNLLRHNSLLMEPTRWQKRNVPLGPNEPWLTSFITPVYNDNEPVLFANLSAEQFIHGVFFGQDEDEEEDEPEENAREDVSVNCAKCGKKNRQDAPLRRCSRCKAIHYCSRDCQKKHWSAHKKDCTGRQ